MENMPESFGLQPSVYMADDTENPFRHKLKSREGLVMAVVLYFAIYGLVTFIQNNVLSSGIAVFEELELSALLCNVITYASLIVIGRFVYKNFYGAIAFCGIVSLSSAAASALATALTKPFFIYSLEIGQSTMLTTVVSFTLKLAFSIGAVLLFESVQKKEDTDPDCDERFPGSPVVFILLMNFLCELIPSLIAALPSVFMVIFLSDTDSMMVSNFINNIMPILSSVVSLFIILLYYVIIKKKYRLNKRVLCLMSLIYFSTSVSSVILSLLNVGVKLIEVSMSSDILITTIAVSSIATVAGVCGFVVLGITTSKLEPIIRKLR